MRHQLLLFTILIVSLATGMFAVGQVHQFFTQQRIILDSWSEESQVIAFAEDDSSLVGRVLGVATQDDLDPPTTASQSFQGYLFDKYFEQNNSPLAGHGEDFVKACKKYNTPSDCTLLPAIAKIETNQCKAGLAVQQQNCWGWGGSGSNRIIFTSLEESIDTITRRLKEGYGDRFFNNANNGALYYCGAHCTSWGNHVESEKRNIAAFFAANGYPGLLDD